MNEPNKPNEPSASSEPNGPGGPDGPEGPEGPGAPPPEWCRPGDLENFVLLLSGLKESLAEDRRADPAVAAGGRRAAG
ncbi:hypothetical protein OG455_16950 [Kitasatospora sp. NBC_01287]|uniref:hypothetical protein n=1 Tax=Kitasatospora sp. NBC_01287 TaxID=2903573 RepID=UPI0022566D5C|nr:hypothetical protein [Kitasatospora sp. NBC_01287]MCX4747186.1 hypothetical protein [Kitasatospora sp. NBC_01287]